MTPAQADRIRYLNYVARTAPGVGGHFIMTEGIMAQEQSLRSKLVEAMEKFSKFDKGNDPYGEQDFGAIEVEGVRAFWKIEYFERGSQFQFGSEAPWDHGKTERVLTLMLAEEY